MWHITVKMEHLNK